MSELSGIQISMLGEQFRQIPPIQQFDFTVARNASVSMDCLRLDKLHPFISGNKWYKLKHHIQAAHAAGKSRILSFGGAHSNHLHALAYVGKWLNFSTVGVVRGEPGECLTTTLQDCVDWGMDINWLSRRDYRNIAPDQCISDYSDKYPDTWVIPEGGASAPGIAGIQELFSDLFKSECVQYDVIVCPVGSGATLAGIASAEVGQAKCIGFSALKGAYDLEARVDGYMADARHVNPWEICHDYHFGGFAKMNQRLADFISEVYQSQNLLLDPIYTGKMLFGLLEWIYQGRVRRDAKVLFVHTGGLQGWRGFGNKSPALA